MGERRYTLTSLLQTITLLAQGVGVGTVLSFLLEKVPRFQKLSSDAKWYFTLALSVLLPLGATLALQYVPPEVWVQIEPYWQALMLGLLTWGGSQVAHKLDKSNGRG